MSFHGQYSTEVYTDLLLERLQSSLRVSKNTTDIDSLEEEGAHIDRTITETPLFLYMAYQAVHTPIDPPSLYYGPCEAIRPHVTFQRYRFCAMMQTVDTSVGKIMDYLDDIGRKDDFLIILSTDNGGDYTVGSSNWPLKGNKVNRLEEYISR